MRRLAVNDPTPALTRATEGDIDLFLVEDLRCSDEFLGWFLGTVERRTRQSFRFHRREVLHSRRRTFNRREIDIHLTLRHPRGDTWVLIKNKLDASEQSQVESCRAECDTVVKEGRAIQAIAVLVCPEEYRRTNAAFARHFDTVITYEEVCHSLIARSQCSPGELGLRLAHRAELLNQAIQGSSWLRGSPAGIDLGTNQPVH